MQDIVLESLEHIQNVSWIFFVLENFTEPQGRTHVMSREKWRVPRLLIFSQSLSTLLFYTSMAYERVLCLFVRLLTNFSKALWHCVIWSNFWSIWRNSDDMVQVSAKLWNFKKVVKAWQKWHNVSNCDIEWNL